MPLFMIIMYIHVRIIHYGDGLNMIALVSTLSCKELPTTVAVDW